MKTIPLTQGMKAIVDDEDYKHLNQWNWYYSNHGYACRKPYKHKGIISMHRLITNCPDDMQVDHINGNKFDNRKENLRIVTNTQNLWNRPMRKDNSVGYKGVRFKNEPKRVKKYYATISVNGEVIHLGYFETDIEAAKSYDEAARKYHGEFAKTNF